MYKKSQLYEDCKQRICHVCLLPDLQLYYSIKTNKMGCGALCGDNPIASVQLPHAQKALITIISQIQYQPQLVDKSLFENFLTSYYQQPEKFQLTIPPKLTKGQQVPSNIMLKWKIVLFGLDHKSSAYSSCLGLPQYSAEQSLDKQNNLKNDQTLLFHSSFPQIQKDLDRTFQLPQGRKHQFQNVLKRIANHFPKMGYTQGLNLIICYLIIIGYSQQDSFWIFVHIAINRRYLLLGLYQDGFPLSNAFTTLFNNILKRKDHKLYIHVAQIDSSLWIFKWFTTCFLYSFPMQLVTYIWDLMINVGSIGIIAFAVSLVLYISPVIKQLDDLADFCDFFNSLKQIQVFNQNVNLSVVTKKAYEIDFVFQDFTGIQELAPFYGQIIKKQYCFKESLFTETSKLSVSQINKDKALQKWYNNLIEERVNFKFSNTSKDQNKNLHLQVNSIQKSFLPQKKVTNEYVMNVFQPQKPKKEAFLFTNFQDLSKDSTEITKQKSTPQIIAKPNILDKKHIGVIKFDQIGQLFEGISQKSQSIYSVVSKRSALKVPPALDQIDRMSMQFNNSKNNYGQSLIKRSIPPRKNSKNKTENPPPQLPNHKSIYLAGKNIMKEQSYDASVSSKQSKNSVYAKPRRGKNSPKMGICGCKTKTQQNNFPIKAKPISQYQSSSNEHFSDNNSIVTHNIVNAEDNFDNRSLENFQSTHIGGKTEDLMTNSHGPAVVQSIQTINFSGEVSRQKNSKEDAQIEKCQVFPFKKSKFGKNSRISHIEINNKLSKQKSKQKKICAVCHQRSAQQDQPQQISLPITNRYNCQVESTC